MNSNKLTLIKKIIEQQLDSFDFDKEIERNQKILTELRETPADEYSLSGNIEYGITNRLDKWRQMDLDNFFKRFVVLAGIKEFAFGFEGKLGVDVSVSLGAALFGGKVRGALGIEGALIDKSTFTEDNDFIEFTGIDTTMQYVVSEIKKLVNIDKEDTKPEDLRQSLIKITR
ncbi:hypothetical protein JL193_07250 [Polaribacter batillariae]|uniref:Uncharacterized protein n=1 Tax=Polaribacter batillariae TaxID=2808900 RepID=A0ABX7SXQ0_9FLAO|nr:hypothetical protein [Polaribacter batillariae]QTD39037.1 hypothetical protein JL193_07250 [Polaribacter batillariae]